MIDPLKIGKKRGIVLMATLVFIFMLTVIVIFFIEEVESRILYRAQTVGDHDLRRIAYDYLEHSYAVLSEFQTFDSGLHMPAQGWGNPLEYAPFPIEYPGLEVVVSITDETNEIPISALDENNFIILLESMGVNSFDGSRLRDGYYDWIDGDDDPRIHGAEKREYEIDHRYLISPPNALIRDEGEFDYISGFYDWNDPSSRYYDPELLEHFKRSITLIHDYPVNLNAARPEVMEFFRLLNGINPETLLLYQAGDDQILNTLDDRILSETAPVIIDNIDSTSGNSLFAFETRICRISIDIKRYESVGFHLEALLDLGGDVGTPESESDESGIPTNTLNKKAENNPNITHSNTSISETFEILVIRENFVEFE